MEENILQNVVENEMVVEVHELLKHLEADEAKSKALYDAAAMGQVRTLQKLLEHDSFLLNRVAYTACLNKTTPLHIATINGRLDFVQEILQHNPSLAEELDAQQSSALHFASDKGHLELVRELLKIAPEKMCLSRDCRGRNPLHLAAMNGHVDVLKELVTKCQFSAQEKLDGGVTMLHFCVKYNRLEALKVLKDNLIDQLNAKDDNGDTVLHMAVKDNQHKTIKYLAETKGIDLNAEDGKGRTAFDISASKEIPNEIRKMLRPRLFSFSRKPYTQPWLSQNREAVMVVAVLLATIAFQAGLNPPGGVWQDTFYKHEKLETQAVAPTDTKYMHFKLHVAGKSVMATEDGREYDIFVISNTFVLISSLSTIVLLISGLPFRRRLYVWILMVIMWLTVSSIVLTYLVSIHAVAADGTTVADIEEKGLIVWGGVVAFPIVGNMVRLICKWLKTRGDLN